MKRAVLILHGWGLSGSSYKELGKLLSVNGYSVYMPNLPGFANEPLVHPNMNLDDYIEFVHDFIKQKRLKKPVIIGHSFGGRVGIKFAWKYPQEVSTLVLTGVPVIRHRAFVQWIAYLAAVVGGNMMQVLPLRIQQFLRKLLYFMIGEWDYYNAGPLRQVFKNIINEDLRQYMQGLRIPVVLLWGGRDRITPVEDIKKIHKALPTAQHSIVETAGHKLPYQNYKEFFREVQRFL